MVPAFRARSSIFFFIVLLIILSSCSAHKPTVSNSQARRNNHAVEQYNRESIAGYIPFTVASYIERFKKIAVKEMDLYGIPASITLAQGLFESANGNSDLAKIANNHFGIKCTSDWTGKSYYKNDDRDNDCFRVYTNPEDSYRDHSEFLKRKRYAPLFELDKNDYRGWAYGLKQAGYATNPKYPDLLIGVIERYHLDQYDKPEGEIQKIKREDRVLAEINNNIGSEKKDAIIQNTPSEKLHTVVAGDTLYNISKRFGLSVDELKALNNMPDNSLKLGQKLVVVK
jgi:hypothetical protein